MGGMKVPKGSRDGKARGRLHQYLPSWRNVPCSECGNIQMVREDIKGPVLCDACDLGPLFA